MTFCGHFGEMQNLAPAWTGAWFVPAEQNFQRLIEGDAFRDHFYKMCSFAMAFGILSCPKCLQNVSRQGRRNGKLLLNLRVNLDFARQAPTLSEKAAPAWCAL